MKKQFIIFYLMLFLFYSNASELLNSSFDTRYVPRWVKYKVFQQLINDGITDETDRGIVNSYYWKDGINFNYYLRTKFNNMEDLLKLSDVLSKYPDGRSLLALEKAKVDHETAYPVFSQKGGMLFPGDHSFYFRTDDEWTGFSTIFLGYRYGVAEYFNIAVEGGVGLPQVYLANLLLHFKMYETPKKMFFLGTRVRLGYKFQNSETFLYGKDAVTGESTGYLGLGKNYLNIVNRHSFYFAADLTAAFRFGRYKAQSVYYTIFPKIDFDLLGGPVYVLFCPIMTGYEVRFGKKMEWSFAVEAGYTMPLPWGSVPDGQWVNFPSLANVSVNYRFGNKFYSKENQKIIAENAVIN